MDLEKALEHLAFYAYGPMDQRALEELESHLTDTDKEMERQQKRILELEDELVDAKRIPHSWFKKATRLEKMLAKAATGGGEIDVQDPQM